LTISNACFNGGSICIWEPELNFQNNLSNSSQSITKNFKGDYYILHEDLFDPHEDSQIFQDKLEMCGYSASALAALQMHASKKRKKDYRKKVPL
jgi:hypothetical protein